MGCARNLKLGGERGARARVQRDTIFCGCGSNVGPYSVVMCMEKMQRSPGAKPLVRGHAGFSPWSWNTNFWTCSRSRKFASFLIFGNAKSSQIFVFSCKNDVYAKVPKGDFITIKIFLRAAGKAKGMARGQLLPYPLWRRPLLRLNRSNSAVMSRPTLTQVAGQHAAGLCLQTSLAAPGTTFPPSRPNKWLDRKRESLAEL